MPSGVTEIPFEIPLIPKKNRVLYETYHGVFINIQYKLKCDVKRSFLAKGVMKETDFVVEYNVGMSYDSKNVHPYRFFCNYSMRYLFRKERSKINRC